MDMPGAHSNEAALALPRLMTVRGMFSVDRRQSLLTG